MRSFCRSLLVFSVGMFVFVGSVPVAPAQEESVKPGINDKYKTADVERTAKMFEGEKRDVVVKRDEILAACQLKPGMTVADVGAGTGLFTRLFASKVAPEGKVFAVDITESFVEHIEKTCEEQGIENVACIVCTPKSAKLPPESVELVFLCDTYHHFEYPFKMLDSIRTALRSDGRLIIIDRKDASNHVRADQATVKSEAVAAGFKFLDESKVSEKEYLMRFQKVERADSSSVEPGVRPVERTCLPG
jgi:predicted methyltransferase